MPDNLFKSAIFAGTVRHQRFDPIKHKFTYRVFMLLLDLDELPALFDRHWLWSARRTNLACFRRSDHLGDAKQSLKQAVVDLVKQRTGHELNGSIRLLTHLRYWGYCFNPVSFYYCYDPTDQRVEVIVAEVHNTPWNEQYCYILTPSQNHGSIEHQHYIFPKAFHVSPLLPMDFIYDWRFGIGNEKLFVHMKNIKQTQEVFNATLSLRRRAINRINLAKTLWNHPFMTGKVISSIYWQALLLRLKGAKFYPRSSSK